jgi:hypothetical protein
MKQAYYIGRLQKMGYFTCKIIKQKHIMVKGVRRKGERQTKSTLSHRARVSSFQVLSTPK